MELKRHDKFVTNTLSDAEYRNFTDFLEDACGIVLGANKHYLITSRMKRIMTEYKLGSLSELMAEMTRDRTTKLRDRVIESMTTNETSWFRDNQPYIVLKQNILPEIAKKKNDRVRIWSSACSSGQEPYSIAISTHEYQMANPGAMTASIEIMATDISPEMLRRASSGIYDEAALMRGMSPDRKKRYFEKQDENWKISHLIHSKVIFRELNLLQSYALLGRFDVIFCRNVLIYFSRDSKRDIVNRMAKSLKPGGYLILGGSESMTNVSDLYEMEKIAGCVLYRVKPT